MSKLAEYLNRRMTGNVYERADLCAPYATDQSLLKIPPKLVALPESSEDVRKLLGFIYQLAIRGLNLPVTARGAGSDQTGAAIGPGLILSMERMNHIEELDTRGRLVRVQPGITLGDLNQVLRPEGLCLPLSAPLDATLGGLVCGGIADSAADRHASLAEAVDSLEVVLANGELIQVSPYGERELQEHLAGGAEGTLYRKILRLLDDHADIVIDRGMQPFDAAGYAGISHVRDKNTTSLLPLFFGSQGTLGIITDMILRLEPLPGPTQRIAVALHDAASTDRFLRFAAELSPSDLKLIDVRMADRVRELGKQTDLFGAALWRTTDRRGREIVRKFNYLVIVSFDFAKVKTRRLVRDCLAGLPRRAVAIPETPENASEFRKLMNLFPTYLSDSEAYRPPVLDEVYIPADNLETYLSNLLNFEDVFGQPLPVYGSYLTGTYTVRPEINLSAKNGHQTLLRFIQLYSEIVAESGGSITGRTPEGRIKALITNRDLKVGERQIYSAVKEAYDPKNILNPGVKLGFNPHDIVKYLKTS